MDLAKNRRRNYRLTVRLDPEREALLRRLAVAMGRDPSHVLREALDGLAAQPFHNPETVRLTLASDALSDKVGPAPKTQSMEVSVAEVPQSPRRDDVFPPINLARIDELMLHYRAMGSEIWPERRRLFHRLYCAAFLAQENGENPRDAELHNELFRIGKEFSLFN